jgi:hypothetical protein
MQGIGAVDISNRGVIKITGNDRKAFLHSLTSQHIERMKAGESCSTLLLTPNGHIEHELHVINSDNEIYIIVEKSSLIPVLEFFKKMVFMSQVEITDQTSNLATVFEPVRENHKDFPTWLRIERAPPTGCRPDFSRLTGVYYVHKAQVRLSQCLPSAICHVLLWGIVKRCAARWM